MGNDTSGLAEVSTRIVLMGDSTLDDFCWADGRRQSDLENQMRRIMAVDRDYLQRRRKQGYDPPYPHIESGNMIHPLKCLQRVRKATKKDVQMVVVLSLGSFDIRTHMELGRPELVIDAIKTSGFLDDYHQLVEKVLQLGCDLILLSPYEFHESFMEDLLHLSREDVLGILECIYQCIARVAFEFGLPIIDLARSLSCFDRSHYGISAFEPSPKGGDIVMHLVGHVCETHGFDALKQDTTGEKSTYSKVYFGDYSNMTRGISVSSNTKQSKFDWYKEVLKIQSSATVDGGDMGLLADLFGDDGDDVFNPDAFMVNIFSSDDSPKKGDDSDIKEEAEVQVRSPIASRAVSVPHGRSTRRTYDPLSLPPPPTDAPPAIPGGVEQVSQPVGRSNKLPAVMESYGRTRRGAASTDGMPGRSRSKRVKRGGKI